MLNRPSSPQIQGKSPGEYKKNAPRQESILLKQCQALLLQPEVYRPQQGSAAHTPKPKG